MKIKSLIESCATKLTDCYGGKFLPSQRKALDAMLACRSQCGEFYTRCPHCCKHEVIPLSCGHRNCPQCQDHLGALWLDRQEQKLLPVNYFMVTFTIPRELRETTWQHQSIMYDLLFEASVKTLKTVGLNNHGVHLSMTGVLHTHTRKKDYHPHIHFVLPGGGLIDRNDAKSWKCFEEKFFINETTLATIFRGILLKLLFEQSFDLPYGIPKDWVAHVKCVGKGEKALAYLSRYLYRGVISEKDIVRCQDDLVTFRYRESDTNIMKPATLPTEKFIWKLLKHVLPRGFRRVRDFGFLHPNAKSKLKALQSLLKAVLPKKQPKKEPMKCRSCFKPVEVELVIPKRIPMRFRFYPKPRPPMLST